MNKAHHQGRVILTYGRSLMSLVIARSLGQQGIEVIGCDDVDLTVLQFSKHVKETFVHPPYDEDPEHFLEVMEKKVLEFAPADDRPYVLMPVFRETKLFAANKNWFEPTIKIATPSHDSISMVDPKDKLAKTAGSIGLDIPKTWILKSIDDVDDIETELDYPVLIKPASGVGGRGIEQIDSRLHLERYLDANEVDIVWPFLVQDLVDGEDYCCPIIADHGQIKAIAAYQNLTTFPRKTGAGAVRKSIDHQPFLETVEKLVAHTNWTGIAQLDFRWDGQDAPKLIEVNAQFWAGLFHSVSSGIDFPWALYELTAFGNVSPTGPVDKSKITKSTAIWLPSILDDVVRSDDSFEQIKLAWEETKTNIDDGEVVDAIQSALKISISKNKSFIDVLEFLLDEITNIKHAPTELS